MLRKLSEYVYENLSLSVCDAFVMIMGYDFTNCFHDITNAVSPVT